MLFVHPQTCLQDEKCTITAVGLKPFQTVTLSSHLKDTRKKDFFAYTHYKADELGNVDVSIQEAHGGHYTGLFQMGLIAALQPAPHEYQYLRLFKKDIDAANKIEIRLYDGWITPEDIFNPAVLPLSQVCHTRLFVGPGVKRIKIREGNVRGALFLPPGEGPHPGVIDMFGTAGGLIEYRAAQLASRGIAALALAYFDYEDLPKNLVELDMNYFREAAQILLKQKSVCKPGIGVIGVSKGGDLALSIATFIPEVVLSISINGCNANTTEPLRISKNKVIPGLLYDMRRVKFFRSEAIMFRGVTEDPKDHPETIIPIHEADAQFMFVIGEDDRNFDTLKYANYAIESLRRVGKTNYKLCSYKGAGHLIEPPYSAVCPVSYHKIFDIPLVWGGELKAHTIAQEDSWIQMIKFIKENLQNQARSKL